MSEYSVPPADVYSSTRSSTARSTSAFSRLANYVAPSSSGSVGSSAGAGSFNSQNNSNILLTQQTASGSNSPISAGPSLSSRLPKAFDSLEALASADNAHNLAHGKPRSHSTLRTESSSSSPRRGRREYESRSRSREHYNNHTQNSPGQPTSPPAHNHSSINSYWGMESLPPNVNPNYDPGASAFFPLSLDDHRPQFQVGSFAPAITVPSSMRSYPNSSSFQIGNSFHINSPASAPRNESAYVGVGSVGSFADEPNTPASGASPSPAYRPSRAHTYNDRSSSVPGRRSESVGTRGGADGDSARPSRGLRFAIPTVAREARGVVAIAKAREGERGRVAVAGRTFLRVLKVPYGERAHSPSARRDDSPGGGLMGFRTSAIASRRSASKSAVHNHAIDEDSEYGDSVDIVETLDVRLGSRLNGTHLFSDVAWGYSATANKLATSLTNGSVALWDMAKEGGTKLEFVKSEHERAVNKVVFGGQTGSWMMSGAQDGMMKLWDIRDGGKASMTLKAVSSSIRHLSFSPSAAQPFTLLACTAGGYLLRYDLRNTGRRGVEPTDRIPGHKDSILALSWRDNLPGERTDAGGRGDGGWVVTAGLDKQIKIWDFGVPTIAFKPTRTLYTSQTVQSLAWHPTRPTELASSAWATLGQDAIADDALSSSAQSDKIGMGTSASSAGDGFGARLSSAETFRNEIEIWDVTRPWYPKASIKTDEAPSQIVYNDEGTIWAGAKAFSTFAQYDTTADSYNLYDQLAPPGAPCNAEGELAYIDDGRKSFPPSATEYLPLDGSTIPQFAPTSWLCSLFNPDPDFDPNQFGYLAENLEVGGGAGEGEQSFESICAHNARVSEFAGRPDAAELWTMLKLWVDDPNPDFCKPDTPPKTPPLPQSASPATAAESIAALAAVPFKVDDWSLPPAALALPSNESIVPPRNATSVPARRSFSKSLALRRTSTTSPVVLPVDLPPKAPLDHFSEESAASSSDADAGARRGRRSRSRKGSNPAKGAGSAIGCYGEDAIMSTSSESEHELVHHFRSLAGSNANLNPLPKMQRSMTNGSRISGRERSSTLLGEPLPDITGSSASSAGQMADRAEQDEDETFANVGAMLHSCASSGSRLQSRRPSSSSGSDGDSDAEDRLKTSILNARQATLATRARRASSNMSGDRKAAIAALAAGIAPLGSAGPSTAARDSRRSSADAIIAMSRRGSTQFSGRNGFAHERQMTGASAISSAAPLASTPPVPAPGPSAKELARLENHKLTEQATESVKGRVHMILQKYADGGDSQLCAIVACALAGRVALPVSFVARVSSAYIALLRRLDLHVAAAAIIKHTSAASIRAQGQVEVVWHTACGACGKAIESPPFDLCLRCRKRTTQCVICHQSVGSLFLFCATCGHGAHSNCLADYADALASAKQIADAASGGRDLPSSSHPSTPGFTGSVRKLMWNEARSQAVSPADELAGGFSAMWAKGEHGEGPIALRTCPHGMCGHATGCILSEVGL